MLLHLSWFRTKEAYYARFSEEAEVQLFDQENKDSSLGFDAQEFNEGLEGKTIERSQGDRMEKIELSLTTTLYQKLRDKSKKEGVTVNELVSELLAEGLVLRAWEIMERKSYNEARLPWKPW